MILLAQVVITAILLAAFLIEDRRLDKMRSFIKSDPAIQARFDDWNRNPPSQQPPTD